MEHLFVCLIVHAYIIFGTYSHLLSNFYWIVCLSIKPQNLYIFWIQYLSDTWFTNSFLVCGLSVPFTNDHLWRKGFKLWWNPQCIYSFSFMEHGVEYSIKLLIVLFNSSIFLLVFNLVLLSITEKRVLKIPTIIIVCLLNYIFYFMFFIKKYKVYIYKGYILQKSIKYISSIFL